MEKELVVVVKVVQIMLRTLSDRVLTLVSLLMVFGLTCWAMFMPDPYRLGTVAFFALAVFLPLMHKEKRYVETQETEG